MSSFCEIKPYSERLDQDKAIMEERYQGNLTKFDGRLLLDTGAGEPHSTQVIKPPNSDVQYIPLYDWKCITFLMHILYITNLH